MYELTQLQVSAFRLTRHHLACRAPLESLASVAWDMCGVQAQVMTAAQMALWARVRELMPEDVERALWQERTLVKTWCMRGTVHLLAAADLPLFIAALRPSRLPGGWEWLERRGLPRRQAEAMVAATVAALDEGPLTRRELSDRVVAQVGPQAREWLEHGWGVLIRQAAADGQVCFGPNRGQEVTFVRTAHWLPGWHDLPAAEAQRILLHRYLHSYGPMSIQDFAFWTGMKVSEATSIWEQLGDEAVPVTVDGNRKWLLRQDLPLLREPLLNGLPVRLLPGFDSYLLAHRDKGHLVDAAHYKAVYRKAGWISPTVLVDGRIAGIWSHEKRGRRLRVTVEPFAYLPAAIRQEIELEAADLGRFLGCTGETVFLG